MEINRNRRDPELEWINICAVICVVLYNCCAPIFFEDESKSEIVPENHGIFSIALSSKIIQPLKPEELEEENMNISFMKVFAISIMPILFSCSSEMAISYIDPCTYSNDESRNENKKSYRAVIWYYENILVSKTKEILPFFLFSYLVVDKLHLYSIDKTKIFDDLRSEALNDFKSGNTTTMVWDSFQNFDWSFMPHSSFFLCLWAMFIVNGFYLGSLGSYGFIMVIVKLVFVIIPWSTIESGGDVSIIFGSIAAFIIPYTLIFASTKFFPGNLIVCWINITTLFLCTCFIKYLPGSSSDEAYYFYTSSNKGFASSLELIEMNHYFICGMLLGSMFGCFGSHASWMRGFGLLSFSILLFLQAAQISFYGVDSDEMESRSFLFAVTQAIQAWTWMGVSRCIARSIFADQRRDPNIGGFESFLYESSNYIYAIHLPFASIYQKSFGSYVGNSKTELSAYVFLLTMASSLAFYALCRLLIRCAPTFLCCFSRKTRESLENCRGKKSETLPALFLGKSPPNSVMGTPIAGVKSECRQLVEKSKDKDKNNKINNNNNNMEKVPPQRKELMEPPSPI